MDKISFQDLKTKISTKGLFIVIAVVLIGIFTIMVVEIRKETPGEKIANSIDEMVDSAGEGLEEFSQEVEDEIDDNTNLR